MNLAVAHLSIAIAVITSGCGTDGLSKQDASALKHHENSPMPQAARDLMKDPSKVKAAGEKYGSPADN